VTPEEGGALLLLEKVLGDAGFDCTRVDRNGTPNLFARWGQGNARKVLGFNGHTDVVPVGDPEDWTHPPFSAHREDGWLYGRGATDMKSGVAAFVAAAVDMVRTARPTGRIVIAITGDEEGPGRDGTIAILDWMETVGERMDACIVGEPTSRTEIGDMIKIGRRGVHDGQVRDHRKTGAFGLPAQGAEPDARRGRPRPRLSTHVLDEGTEHFDPSTISVTTIDTGNAASNVIPARTRMTVNIRFNDLHTGEGLADWLRSLAGDVAQASGTTISTDVQISGEAFLTPRALERERRPAVEAVTGRAPVLSTTGAPLTRGS
jgi:succinyl-diaminopimelate desuccinylase